MSERDAVGADEGARSGIVTVAATLVLLVLLLLDARSDAACLCDLRGAVRAIEVET